MIINTKGLHDYINEADVIMNPSMDNRLVIIVNKNDNENSEKSNVDMHVPSKIDSIDGVYKLT